MPPASASNTSSAPIMRPGQAHERLARKPPAIEDDPASAGGKNTRRVWSGAASYEEITPASHKARLAINLFQMKEMAAGVIMLPHRK